MYEIHSLFSKKKKKIASKIISTFSFLEKERSDSCPFKNQGWIPIIR